MISERVIDGGVVRKVTWHLSEYQDMLLINRHLQYNEFEVKQIITTLLNGFKYIHELGYYSGNGNKIVIS